MATPYDQFPKVLQVIEKISQGMTETHACDDVGLRIPVFRDYIKLNDFLKDLVEEAQTRGYDAMAEALLVIDTHGVYGQKDPKMAKVISDNIKWFLSKKKKEYGDRVVHEHTITADRAIIDALNAGRNRAAQAQLTYEPDVTEVEYIDVTPVDEDEKIMAEILS